MLYHSPEVGNGQFGILIGGKGLVLVHKYMNRSTWPYNAVRRPTTVCVCVCVYVYVCVCVCVRARACVSSAFSLKIYVRELKFHSSVFYLQALHS